MSAAPRYSYAMVCSSNMNRSMEAHRLLAEHGMRVASFGIGTTVRMPGTTATEHNVYSFGTPYEAILGDLTSRDAEYYRAKGLVAMLERNTKIKHAPERWQDRPSVDDMDVVFCFQERVYEAVVEDLECRDPVDASPIHVVNMDVVDSPKEAVKGAQLALHFCLMCEQEKELETGVPAVVRQFSDAFSVRLQYSLHFV